MNVSDIKILNEILTDLERLHEKADTILRSDLKRYVCETVKCAHEDVKVEVDAFYNGFQVV